MKKIDYTLASLIALICCLVVAIFAIMTGEMKLTAEGTINLNNSGEINEQLPVMQPETTAPMQTPGTTNPPAQSDEDNKESLTQAPSDSAADKGNAPLTTTKEIIDKYTFLVDKFKKEKPAYKKKEYQSLPEEYREFSSAINFVLGVAENYMVTEDECEELVRQPGAEEILYDVPIHGTEKGCTLTDYNAVERAECKDLGDGTYKISFTLKEEYNAEPTPADTLIPPSAHGAVMQPVAIKDIKAEVDKIAGGIPGVTVNGFDLIYRECVFSCVYNPQTDEVKEITHNIVIDITADVKVFSAAIAGSARLTNDMFIYDITW